jgi:bile acid-coenzyme A ligase
VRVVQEVAEAPKGREGPGASLEAAIAFNPGFDPDFAATAEMPDPATLVPYGTRISQLAAELGDSVAVTFVSESGEATDISWRELDRRSTQVGRALAGAGIGPSDLVALQLKNSPELLYAVFGAWKVGGAPVPVRWDLPDWELARVLEVIGAKVTLSGNDGFFEATRAESTERLPDVVAPISSGICSSGSTGTPKVILRQVPAVYDPESVPLQIQQSWGALSANQVVLTPGPMYHNNGFMITIDLLAGFRCVLMERFNAARAVDLIERYRVTGFTGATPMFQRIAQLDGVHERDFSSIEYTMQGAAVLPDWVARVWFDLIGAERFHMTYGSSEGAGVVACRGDMWMARPGTLGLPWGGTRIRILGPDGDDRPPGELGEIYMRPASGITHYYLGDGPQAPRTDDGFTTIGDLGWLDEDGFLFIADRRVDMIVTGGVNVFPAEIETALSEHPDVADVVVIGLADQEWGRRVHAIVQPRDQGSPPSVAEIISYAKDRLAPYKVPKTVEFVGSIPRSEATKVNRAKLMEERESATAP